MTVDTATLRDNLARVRETIAESPIRAGRQPDSVKLVAVSKTHSAERVAEAAALGLNTFGENRVQEAADKIPRVAELLGTQPEWHLLGTLQRNKVRAALPLFAVIQSVDSLKLAEAIDARAEHTPARILLEVYFGDDPARPGFRPSQLAAQLPKITALPRIQVDGLMTVAPLGLSEAATRAVFASLRDLRATLIATQPWLELPELSMGMTDDYPAAIAEGATIVRVGRAIFGARP